VTAVTYEEFEKEAWKQIREKLADRLSLKGEARHEVVALCCRQLEYTELSPQSLDEAFRQMQDDSSLVPKFYDDWLNPIAERTVEVRYVQDCKQIVEYLAEGTSKERREEIRGEFWEWAYNDTWLLHKTPTGAGLGDAHDGLSNALAKQFERERFKRCLELYKPAEGKMFRNYLKDAIINFRFGDIRRQDRRQPIISDGIDPGTIIEACRGRADDPRLQEELAALKRCIDRLEEIQRQVFELNYAIVLGADWVSDGTARLLDKAPASAKRLDDAKTRRDRAYAAYRLSREELERREYTEAQIECLMREARGREKPDKQQDTCAEELTFIESYQSYAKASDELEDSHFKFPQEQIGILIGKSQPTVTRYLKSAVKSLRECLGVPQDPPDKKASQDEKNEYSPRT